MAQLIPALFPPTASFKYEGCCKESYYDAGVISLLGTSPLTTKNFSGTAPKTRLCKGSLFQLSPAQWVTSCVRLATHLFVQPSTMFAACAMLQPHDQLV